MEWKEEIFSVDEDRFEFGSAGALNIQHKTCRVSRFPLYHPRPLKSHLQSIANAFGGEAIPELIFRF